MDDDARLNRAVRRAAKAAQPVADRAEAAYLAVLDQAVLTAIDNVREHSPVVAAANGWRVPDADEVLNVRQLQVDLHNAGLPMRVEMTVGMAEAVREALALSFDVRNPAIEGVIEQLGGQITHVSNSWRRTLMRHLDAAWRDGLSIQDMAAQVSTEMQGLSVGRATLIARTEFCGATNGGALASAKAAGVAAYKQWVIGHHAAHPRHELDASLDGQVRHMDDSFMVDGHAMMYPGDPAGPPEEVCNCRCTIVFADRLSKFDGVAASTQPPVTVRAADEEEHMPREVLTSRVVRESFDEPRTPRRGVPTGRVAFVGMEVTAAGEDGRRTWSGEIMFVDTPTGDGREYASAGFGHRDLPLPLMAMFEDEHGGMGGPISVLSGQIDTITLDGTRILATGSFSNDENGARAAAAVESGDMSGISVDPSVSRWEVIFPAQTDGEDVDEEQLMEAFFGVNDEDVVIEESIEDGVQFRFLEWSIMGATLVPFPAFEDARISVDDAAPASSEEEAVTASAAGMAPQRPPREWFDTPEADEPTPLTVTDDGQVYGHLACWGTCHTGFEALSHRTCVQPPASAIDYRNFHQRRCILSDGETIACGGITVDTGHAGTGDRFAAASHYDKTGSNVAFVRARDGALGIWLSGAVDPDATAEQVRALKQHAVSGDWRRDMDAGQLELVAALSVPVPGFPIPLVASGVIPECDEPVELMMVAAGVVTQQDADEAHALADRAARRRRVRALAAKAHGGLEGLRALAHGE